jgi:hypothetical protein
MTSLYVKYLTLKDDVLILPVFRDIMYKNMNVQLPTIIEIREPEQNEEGGQQ